MLDVNDAGIQVRIAVDDDLTFVGQDGYVAPEVLRRKIAAGENRNQTSIESWKVFVHTKRFSKEACRGPDEYNQVTRESLSLK